MFFSKCCLKMLILTVFIGKNEGFGNNVEFFQIFWKNPNFFKIIPVLKLWMVFSKSGIWFRYVIEKFFFTEVTNFWQKFLHNFGISKKAKKAQNDPTSCRNFWPCRNFWNKIFLPNASPGVSFGHLIAILDDFKSWPK